MNGVEPVYPSLVAWEGVSSGPVYQRHDELAVFKAASTGPHLRFSEIVEGRYSFRGHIMYVLV